MDVRQRCLVVRAQGHRPIEPLHCVPTEKATQNRMFGDVSNASCSYNQSLSGYKPFELCMVAERAYVRRSHDAPQVRRL